MHYTYVLKSQKDDKYYIGCTSDIDNRYKQHQNGEVFSTKGRRPFELVFYEAFIDQTKAIKREKYLKTAKGKTALSRILG